MKYYEKHKPTIANYQEFILLETEQMVRLAKLKWHIKQTGLLKKSKSVDY